MQCKKQMKMPLCTNLDAYQSICLFGWWNQPRMVLTWNDVKVFCFTWRQMRALGITADELKEVQPCKTEWIQRGGIQIEDLHDMTTFPVNPITDFGCDLAELWKMKLSHDSMKKMQITYDQLLDQGITPAIMHAFDMQLSHWHELGFTQTHASVMSSDECEHVFGIAQSELICILKSFERPPRTTMQCIE